ncbi:MAG: PD40 domain-containing protein [Bradymonadaceae bacterium]|nr:PD40 domain-containing protein [Lujinxingiaceae bacterium]
MTPRAAAVLAILTLLALVGCQTTASDPAGERFREDVLPVLEARCAAAVCHGYTNAGLARGESLEEGGFYLRTDLSGRILDWQAARAASQRFINTADNPRFSSLVRKPMAEVYGGLPHGGGTNFLSPSDPGLEAVRAWIALEQGGGEDLAGQDRAGERAGPAERFFAERVQPHLLSRGCAVAACHGPESFVPYRLDPGVVTAEGQIALSRAMTRHNYEASLPFLSLDGDAAQSRLLKKGLPLEAGGITHRGGNRTFFTGWDDPATDDILAWATLEQRAALGERAGRGVEALIYVRGPVQAGLGFDQSSFVPGSDIILRTPAGPDGVDQNLTAHLHAGAADIRHPAVSPDGLRVAFAMRRSEAEGLQLFELTLATGEARALTADPARLASGAVLANVMPVYASAHEIYFVSNRHDTLADGLQTRDMSIYRLAGPGQPPERLTFGPGPELNPRRFNVGAMQGYLVFAHRRIFGDADETVGFSFPLDLHVDYHIYFGITPEERLFFEFVELPDGRALTIAGDPDNVWAGGRLGLIDRNLGPQLQAATPVDKAAVAPAVRNFRVLDPSVSARGRSVGGIYRDPAALADGSILAAWAPGPIDLGDPEARPRFRIVHLRFEEATSGCVTSACLPNLIARDVWVEDRAGGLSVHSARPVIVRALGGPSAVVLDPLAASLVSIDDAPVNQGILESLFPTGPKRFRTDARYMRFVEALPHAPRHAGQATGARILGEVALYDDHSVHVVVPAGVAFRTQLLDADRMALGVQHNRWLFNWPGQHFKESVGRHLYDARCGGCHGAASGKGADLFGPTDTLTGATVTLARYVDRNPRLPRPPVVLTDATRQEIDFARAVWPIIEQRCANAGCHGATGTGLVLEPVQAAYGALLVEGYGSGGARKYVDVTHTQARSSYLIELVYERELDAPRALIAHPALGLSDEERLVLVRWIETGAHYLLEEHQ